MLDFVTQLCFVTVLMKIYIFELFGLTLMCKELALLACRLTIVYPVLTHKHSVRLPGTPSPQYFYHES